ncbi:VOC family protein [Halorussus limi]|uniref:VOC family protein n=1 Tax=Halorussus limi TaxID=2938695 RepID=A0A8U0HU46_9EURY|nr:VOC family protein [Halorussus limi]UPV74184.1 VOC family protein [Halorussus limi]
MLSGLRWLALEAKYLDRAREFYTTHLDLSVVRESDGEVVLDAGGANLVLREPGAVPRGGVHTHFAFAAPPDRYDEWHDRLAESFDLAEFDFGGAKSLYFYDPDGNCVEIGGVGDGDAAITDVFEIVLEVEDLARAESFYRSLDFEVVDRGEQRRRLRLGGPVDLELWEPQLGIADARGGLHVDVGFAAEDPAAAADAVRDDACAVAEVDGGTRVRDPDGHYLTFRRT